MLRSQNERDSTERQRPTLSASPERKTRDGLEIRLRVTNNSSWQGRITNTHVEGIRGLTTRIEWDASQVAPGQTLEGTLHLGTDRIPRDMTVRVSLFANILRSTYPLGIVPMTFKKPPDPRFKYLTVSLRGSYGAFWIPSGIDGSTRLEPTSTNVMALRVQKGLGEYLAIEGEVAGGTTGSVEFEPGVTRSGSHGRFLLLGVARTGRKTVASARLGFGVQAATYDSDVAEMAGSNVDFLASIGLGLDRRLGPVSIGHRRPVRGGIEEWSQLRAVRAAHRLWVDTVTQVESSVPIRFREIDIVIDFV